MSAAIVTGGLQLLEAAEATLDLERAADETDNVYARSCYREAREAAILAFVNQRAAAKVMAGDIEPADYDRERLDARREIEAEIARLREEASDERTQG